MTFTAYSRKGLVLALALSLAHLSAIGGTELPKVSTPSFPSRTASLAEFGGKGDGQTLNTDAFAKAMAALSDKGGGTLRVPPGIWLTGPITLRSHINLRVERGALDKFSGDTKLYPLMLLNLKGEKEVCVVSPIYGENLEDVAITGEGVIDGAGDAWRPIKRGKLTESEWKARVQSGGALNEKGDTWWPSREAMDGAVLVGRLRASGSLKLEDYEPGRPFLRPKLLRLVNCRKVLLKDVTFQNPPDWTLHPLLCQDVSILNVNVRNAETAQNSDALDLDSCRRAVIRGCTFDVGDDGICLKSGKDASGRRIGVPTEDVLVENCVVYHAHGGFTIGSEMSGGLRNIHVTNCLFMGTDVGLRFKSTRGRGGVVENIFISDVRMADITGDAINFNMFYGGKSPVDEGPGAAGADQPAVPAVTEETPRFENIFIERVVCRGARSAIVLEGLPEMPIRNIQLKDVSITSKSGVMVQDADGIRFDSVRVDSKSGPKLTQTRVKNSTLTLEGSPAEQR